jgi:uncharacterized protein YndB with AHSA1/START domain
MWQATERIEIAAPPEQVWAIVTDVARHQELAGSGEIKTMRISGPIAEGATWEADEKIAAAPRFTAHSTCVAFAPPTEFSWTSVPPPIVKGRPESVPDIRWRFRLVPSGNGTVLEHEVRIVEPRVGASRLRVFYLLTRRWARIQAGMRHTLLNVKHAAES